MKRCLRSLSMVSQSREPETEKVVGVAANLRFLSLRSAKGIAFHTTPEEDSATSIL